MTTRGDRKRRREQLRADRALLIKCGRPLSKRDGHCPVLAGQGTAHAGYGPCITHADDDVHEGWVSALDVARELNISPWDALLKNVRLAAGRVAWVDEQLRAVVAANDGDMSVPVVARWLKESRLERTLMAKMAKAAIDGGVAERMVRQVELEGQLVAAAVVAALDKLELTSEQRTLALEAAHAQLLSAELDQSTTVLGTVIKDERPHRPSDPDNRPSSDPDRGWIPGEPDDPEPGPPAEPSSD
jgi:hypothetical protein